MVDQKEHISRGSSTKCDEFGKKTLSGKSLDLQPFAGLWLFHALLPRPPTGRCKNRNEFPKFLQSTLYIYIYIFSLCKPIANLSSLSSSFQSALFWDTWSIYWRVGSWPPIRGKNPVHFEEPAQVFLVSWFLIGSAILWDLKSSKTILRRCMNPPKSKPKPHFQEVFGGVRTFTRFKTTEIPPVDIRSQWQPSNSNF